MQSIEKILLRIKEIPMSFPQAFLPLFSLNALSPFHFSPMSTLNQLIYSLCFNYHWYLPMTIVSSTPVLSISSYLTTFQIPPLACQLIRSLTEQTAVFIVLCFLSFLPQWHHYHFSGWEPLWTLSPPSSFTSINDTC